MKRPPADVAQGAVSTAKHSNFKSVAYMDAMRIRDASVNWKWNLRTMSNTLLALLGFTCWALFLLVLMEAIRSKLVLTGQVAANGFNPENSNLSSFMQRLARAHANCLEGLPIFGGLMVVAVIAGKSSITDPLAFALVAARIVQSTIHLISTSSAAVTARFAAFAVQMGIAVYWAFKLHGA
jgi:uncharacterized MAPEG superfamily protein